MKDRNNGGKRINHFIFGKAVDRPLVTPSNYDIPVATQRVYDLNYHSKT